MNDAIAALAYYANMFHIYNKKTKKLPSLKNRG